jgi:glycosyltransferase involved in cell wall biosynthesis
MAEPLVSILMITYNHEGTIGQAIESILEQNTDYSFELIVGEDCSSDNTRNIVLNYQKQYPQIIRLITSDKNVGMMNNYRRVIQEARGKYIALCEGDDFWCDSAKLQKQIDVMEADPSITLCFHNVRFLYGDGSRSQKQFKWRFRDRFYQPRDVICMGGEFYKIVSAVIRRQVLSDPPDWYLQAPVGDWAVSLLSALNGKVYYLNDVMAVYRSNIPNSWSQMMYSNPAIYKEHLFHSMKTRKMANDASGRKYEKCFGRRIGRDIKWLIIFNQLSEEELLLIREEYFELLSPIDRFLVKAIKALKVERFVTFLRKIKKRVVNGDQ